MWDQQGLQKLMFEGFIGVKGIITGANEASCVFGTIHDK